MFVSSDHHFGEESFHKYNERYKSVMRPEFADAQEFVDYYVNIHNLIVPEFDSQVYFLGDIAHNITWAEQVIPQLNGQHKFLVMGNHDSKYPTFRLQSLFDKLFGVVYLMNKKYVLTHIPAHPSELKGMINVHGHTHRTVIPNERYMNACVDHLPIYAPTELA